MKPLVLITCLSPIVIIWIVMKLSLLLFSANDERRYVKAESRKPHGPYVADAYADVDEEEEDMEIAQIIDDALDQYYTVEKVYPVPNWKTNKNPQWWIDYLEELGIDKNNP